MPDWCSGGNLDDAGSGGQEGGQCMQRIGMTSLLAAFVMLLGACSATVQGPTAEERLVAALADPREIPGIPDDAIAEAPDGLWVGIAEADLADLVCATVDDYGTFDTWVSALGSGAIELPESILSESEASALRFLFLARAIESTEYCPSAVQNATIGNIVDGISGVGEAVADSFEESTTTSVFVSIYAVPTEAAAAAWAERAVAYAEVQSWRWDSRDDAVLFYAGYATGRCRSLSLEPDVSPPTTVTGTTSFLQRALAGGRYSSPAQVEAHLRDQLGMEGWGYFGPAWYDSLVKGLCVRR